MSNYFLEPTELPEPPECCDEPMFFDEEEQTCVCLHCGKAYSVAPDTIHPLEGEELAEFIEYFTER